MELLTAHWGKFLLGAIGGAILVLIVGFSGGLLMTKANAVMAVSEAVSDRDVAFCGANGKRLIASGKISAPNNANERNEVALAALTDLLPDEEFSENAIRRCSREFPQAAAVIDDIFFGDDQGGGL